MGKMNNVLKKFQQKLQNVCSKKQDDIPSEEELIIFIVDTPTLWNKFRSILCNNNVITWFATKEVFYMFLHDNIDEITHDFLNYEREKKELEEKQPKKSSSFVSDTIVKFIRMKSPKEKPNENEFNLQKAHTI